LELCIVHRLKTRRKEKKYIYNDAFDGVQGEKNEERIEEKKERESEQCFLLHVSVCRRRPSSERREQNSKRSIKLDDRTIFIWTHKIEKT